MPYNCENVKPNQKHGRAFVRVLGNNQWQQHKARVYHGCSEKKQLCVNRFL